MGTRGVHIGRTGRLEKRGTVRIRRWTLLAAGLLTFIGSRVVQAATIMVDSTLDVAAADGVVTLREAITAANTNASVNEAPAGDPGQDTITFAPGLHGTITLGGYELLITEALSIEGPGSDQLTVSGNDVSRVFHLQNAGPVTISGLSVTRGNSGSEAGGAILNRLSNTSQQPNGFLLLDHVALMANTAPGAGNSGGGVANIGPFADLRVSNSMIAGNSADNGGGIFNEIQAFGTVFGSTVTGNMGATSGNGAGIRNNGRMTITDSTVSNNSGLGGAFSGGGIFNDDFADLEIWSSTVSGNRSEGSGGGVYSGGHNGGRLYVTNSTIVSNASLGGSGGGGVRSTGDLTVALATIADNVDESSAATNAGGISADTSILDDTIVAANSATGAGVPPDVRGAVFSGSGNLIGIGTAELTGIANGTNGNRIGTPAMPIDARLGPLQDNGGPTLTRALLAGSPAIDAGVNAAIPAGVISDQRGFMRIAGPLLRVDIGAVEFGASPQDPCASAEPLSGFASATCACERSIPAACSVAALPRKIGAKVKKACALLGQAAGERPGRGQRRRVVRAARKWEAAARQVMGRRVERALTAPCAAALAHDYGDAADRARRLLEAIGRR